VFDRVNDVDENFDAVHLTQVVCKILKSLPIMLTTLLDKLSLSPQTKLSRTKELSADMFTTVTRFTFLLYLNNESDTHRT